MSLTGYKCPNCGSMIPIPKKGRIYHCPYCDSDYEKEDDDFLRPLTVEVCQARLVTLGCKRSVPREYIRHREVTEKAIEMTIKDSAHELAEGIIPYMEFEEYFDPEQMTTIIGGRVKIADRKGEII